MFGRLSHLGRRRLTQSPLLKRCVHGKDIVVPIQQMEDTVQRFLYHRPTSKLAADLVEKGPNIMWKNMLALVNLRAGNYEEAKMQQEGVIDYLSTEGIGSTK